jgi:hypothetical protein
MRYVLSKRGVASEKLIHFPNGAYHVKRAIRGEFRAANCLGEESFLIVYCGNLGVKQGLHRLMESFRQVRNDVIQLVMASSLEERHGRTRIVAGIGT